MNRCTIRNVGLQTGWFGFFWAPGVNALNGQNVIVQGYPGTTPDASPPGTQWKHRDTIHGSTRRMLFHRADTSGGQSGAPMFQAHRPGCGTCAMGIHTYGYPLLTPPAEQFNSGPRITQARFLDIRNVGRNNG
jgi:glutamyl endopeptidase